ncbi:MULTISPECIES: acyl carrier protein [Actinosynnema]|uniref:acyl carrier protein n=1 Tax=Actinosynnema TaxID=40566 RepID=UPI0020A50483|nr:acyl carrier protein [Actinosynnema pretiosum]MCP2094345.1 acyl carrier protein [Actinosynnema pretiosum]
MTGVHVSGGARVDEGAVARRVREVLAGVLGTPELADGITDATNVVHDLGINSIQMINFLLALEDEFDVELEFEELSFEQLESLPEIRRFVVAAMPDSP